jgi:lysozyme
MATKELRTSDAGIALITGFEGGQSSDGLFRPYRDAVGVWTIGYGHTAGVGPNSKPLTKAEALNLFRHDLRVHYEPYINALGLPLTQNRFDSLVSFVYNLGPLYLQRGHTMGDALRARNWHAAANAFLEYDQAGGQVLAGLKRRREAERALFLKSASPVTKWTAELTKRRTQLHREKNTGTRAFLIRRINALKQAIHKHRS